MSKLLKRVLSLLMALCMILAMAPVMVTAADSTTVYLSPGVWNVDGARFAARWWNDSGEVWLDMVDSDGDGIYECTQPEGMTKVIFCRMSGSATENNWYNCWNQSADLEFSASAGTCYYVTGWDSVDGYWAAYTAPTYTVAGTGGLCGGNGWDPSDTANDMSYADGIWTKTYANVAAGQHEFKVVMNHSWGTEYPSSNYVLNLDAATDVTIIFNVETKEVSVSTGHNYESAVTSPTCTEAGYTTYICSACGDSYTADKVPATGHTYEGGVCTACGDVETSYEGRYYIATIRSSGNYWYMTNDLGTASTKRYQAEDTGLTALPAEIAFPNANKVFVLEKNADGTYSIYAEGITDDAKYLGRTSGNSGTLVAKENALALTVDYTAEGNYNIHFTASDAERYLALNDTTNNNYFAWYKDGQKQNLTLIPVTGEVVKSYTLTIETVNGEVKLTVPYGANLLAVLEQAAADGTIPAKGYTTPAQDEWTNGEYCVAGTYYMVPNYSLTENDTMPANDATVLQHWYTYGWVKVDTDDDGVDDSWQYADPDKGQLQTGWHYIEENYDDVEGGAWYYFEHKGDSDVRAEGITRVPYPTEAVGGVTYAPNADDLASADKYGYTDATTSLFVFGEDGKFDQSTGAIRNEDNSVVLHYAINGQLPWHIGFVQVGSHVYYFFGENEKAVGDTYVTRAVNVSGFVSGGIYTFGENGNLCRYNGITTMADGTLRYYDNGQLMIGNGLTKVGENYIYVNRSGELVVDAEYYVPANDLGIATGMYTFNENGFMVEPVSTNKNGVYFENGAWIYYENGKLGYGKGLINVSTTWHGEGGSEDVHSGYIYVRSSGELATGPYYITNVENDSSDLFISGQKVAFSDLGIADAPKHGIVDGYYYENNQIVYGAGLIEHDGGWIYVRSNGKVATGAYWVTNTNGNMAQGMYEFGEDGKMIVSDGEDGIVSENGTLYYYRDGKKQYGIGLTQLEDGSYIYVRSNGELATDSYWITNHHDLLEEGLYDFGENGILIIE